MFYTSLVHLLFLSFSSSCSLSFSTSSSCCLLHPFSLLYWHSWWIPSFHHPSLCAKPVLLKPPGHPCLPAIPLLLASLSPFATSPIISPPFLLKHYPHVYCLLIVLSLFLLSPSCKPRAFTFDRSTNILISRLAVLSPSLKVALLSKEVFRAQGLCFTGDQDPFQLLG